MQLFIFQPEMDLYECAATRDSQFPILVVQGELGGRIIAVKIAAEKKILDAGSSILEGLDRLFKIFWVFNFNYTPECMNFWKFMQTTVYKLQCGNVPSTVEQLQALVQGKRGLRRTQRSDVS